MRQASQGPQPDELTSTLERLEPDIRYVLMHFRIPAQDAEDVLQDVVLVYWAKRASIHSPAPWILATLRNRCLVYWRKRRRSLIESIDASLLEEVAGGSAGGQELGDLARDLTGAVDRLPARCRNILRLRYGLEHDGPEIARALGYRPDTVRQVTLRCLSALCRQLTANGYTREAS